MTNADKIRLMSDDELAEWIDKQLNQDREDWSSNVIGCYHCINYGTHHYPNDCGECEWLGGIKQWLQKEAKEIEHFKTTLLS